MIGDVNMPMPEGDTFSPEINKKKVILTALGLYGIFLVFLTAHIDNAEAIPPVTVTPITTVERIDSAPESYKNQLVVVRGSIERIGMADYDAPGALFSARATEYQLKDDKESNETPIIVDSIDQKDNFTGRVEVAGELQDTSDTPGVHSWAVGYDFTRGINVTIHPIGN